MAENERTRRVPRTDDNVEENRGSGHSIADRDTRRDPRVRSERDSDSSESPEVSRTRRTGGSSSDDGSVTRTSRSSGETDSRTTTNGNESETGKSAPVSNGRRTAPQVPGTLPKGCATTSSSLMLMTMAGIAAVVLGKLRK